MRILALSFLLGLFPHFASSEAWSHIDECGRILLDEAREAEARVRASFSEPGQDYHPPSDILEMWNKISGHYFRGAAAGIFVSPRDIMAVNNVGNRGGGVCASVDILNLYWSVMSYYGKDLNQFETKIDFGTHTLKKIDTYVKDRFNVDIAHGITLIQAGKTLRHLLKDAGLEDVIRTHYFGHRELFHMGTALDRQRDNSRTIWLASFVEPGETETAKTHAVVILKNDAVNRKLLVSDPGHPNKIWRQSYKLVQLSDGSWTIELTMGLPASNMTKQILLTGMIEIRPLQPNSPPHLKIK